MLIWNSVLHKWLTYTQHIVTRSWSQSYQTLYFSAFWFLLISLNVRKIVLFHKTVLLSSKKRKNSLFTKKKSLLGLTPGAIRTREPTPLSLHTNTLLLAYSVIWINDIRKYGRLIFEACTFYAYLILGNPVNQRPLFRFPHGCNWWFHQLGTSETCREFWRSSRTWKAIKFQDLL